jgi:hypothetical protein
MPNGDAVDQVMVRIRPIWQAALVTVADDEDTDFFELGGDSFLALIVASEMNKLGYKVARTVVFDHPTLRELARHAAGSPGGEGADQ